MAIAMCDLILPPNWIIAKTFHFKLLVNLALYAWAPAGGGKRGHLPPPGNSKIWGPPPPRII